ncbi:MAG: CoA transferase [Dehalococcoidia bacterium]|nr:CoA transferase [Dehalococcoidia bacterium]
MAMILEGIRVLDLGHWILGPGAAALLGDLGADVIKIEDPVTGDASRGMMAAQKATTRIGGRNWFFELGNRNKRSVTLDLGKPEGREVFYSLVKKSDVVVHNKRPTGLAKVGVDYETLRKHNPRLIYATASSYGAKGPDADKISFDITGQARSGWMYFAGEPDMIPVLTTGGPADRAGAIMTAFGIVAALLHRERTGEGQEVETSLLGGVLSLFNMNIDFYSLLGQKLPRWKQSTMANPLWNYYKCKDDKWIMMAGIQADRYWEDVCKALSLEHIIKDPRFENMMIRSENNAACIDLFNQAFATKPRAEWMEILKKSGDLVFEEVNDIQEVFKDPQVRANNYIVDFAHPVWGKVSLHGFPWNFSRTPASIRLPGPEFGEHTEQVLNEVLGYDWHQITKLKDSKVI